MNNLTSTVPKSSLSSSITIAAVAHNFGRDLDVCFKEIDQILNQARDNGASLVILPEAALGGYLADLMPGNHDFPPALDPYGPEITKLAKMSKGLVVCAGYCEDGGSERYNSAICVSDGQILGNHRKIHQPLRESQSYSPGEDIRAFDTPVGKIGMLICYDKVFPEAARTLALDGATIITSLSAWPASRTVPSQDLAKDRWTERFDILDRTRALENQVIWASANQSGTFGSLRFVGKAKVVGAGGEILAETGTSAGVAIAHVDVETALTTARRSMFHLRDRQPDSYRLNDHLSAGAII